MIGSATGHVIIGLLLGVIVGAAIIVAKAKQDGPPNA